MDKQLEEALQVLGIPADSDRETVTGAYRRLARATHPDVSPNPDAAERFATVAAAYRLVSGVPGPRITPSGAPRTARQRRARHAFVRSGRNPREDSRTTGRLRPRRWRPLPSGVASRARPAVASPAHRGRAGSGPQGSPRGRKAGGMVDLGADRALYSISVTSE